MTNLWIDLETYSETPIKNGTHVYAADAEIMLFAWAIDDGPVSVVDLANGEQLPAALIDALNDPDVLVWAHNSGFDRVVMNHNGFHVPIHRWRDTMVQALAH